MDDLSPLESFYPQLAQFSPVRDVISVNFPDHAADILGQLASGLPLDGADLLALDVIADLVRNESVERFTAFGLGPDEDEFPITVMQFGPVFWIFAPEFDPVGFFGSLEAAQSRLAFEWETAISALEALRNESPD